MKKKFRQNIYDDLGIPRPIIDPFHKTGDFIATLFAGFVAGVTVCVILYSIFGGLV